MVEAEARQRGVVRFDVELELAGQTVANEEPVDRRRVVVVLVLGGLVRLRLDQKGTLEADLVLVLDDHAHEAGHLVVFVLQVRVQKRVVAFAPAPQDVVGAAQFLRGIESLLDLSGREGEDLRIRVRGRAGREAGVAEQVGRAPQELDAGAGLVLAGVVDHGVEDGRRLGPGLAFGCDVAVVEAVERHAQLGEELECGVQLGPTGRQRVVRVEPGAVKRARAEHVLARGRERMPHGDGKSEVVFHPLAEDDSVRLIDLVGEGIG